MAGSSWRSRAPRPTWRRTSPPWRSACTAIFAKPSDPSTPGRPNSPGSPSNERLPLAGLAGGRPRTLPAAVAPVLVGSALAWHDGGFGAPAAALCLAFALLVQIGTNFANDYYDFVRGADTVHRVGPTRAVAAGLVAPRAMHRAMLLVFALAVLVGLGLLAHGGPWLLAV